MDLEKYKSYKDAAIREEKCSEELKRMNGQIDERIKKSPNWQTDQHIGIMLGKSLELREDLRELTDRAIELNKTILDRD